MLNKLKSDARNKKQVMLRINFKMFDRNSLPHKLFLTKQRTI